jgi:hypothetical protein
MDGPEHWSKDPGRENTWDFRFQVADFSNKEICDLPKRTCLASSGKGILQFIKLSGFWDCAFLT